LYNVAVKKPCGNVAKQYDSGFKQKYWWIDRFGKKRQESADLPMPGK